MACFAFEASELKEYFFLLMIFYCNTTEMQMIFV